MLVEMAEQGVTPRQRNLQRRMQDLGEFGVKRRCETQAAFEAVAARCPTQRAFGRDVDGVRLKQVQLLR
jgi:hypothetical protein